MGLLADAFNPVPRGASPGPMDDFWYSRDPGSYVASSGGIALGAETILRCGTVLAAVRFRGDSWAMCPPSTYRKTAKGREEQPDHYSQRVLRNPNTWQTGNRWRHLNGVWMATWGNAFNEIVGGRGSFAEELRPLHPSVTRVKDQRTDGTLVYEHRPQGGQERILGQERVLHFRDLSTDGFVGVPMYQLIQNVVRIALLAEQHAATFLRKGARISGLLVPSGVLNPEERKTLKESVNADFGGANNTGALGILPHGVDLKPLSLSNRDSQSAELDDRTVASILRFLGVPGVVVGFADKTATYASAKEFFESGGIKHCVLPILVNAEAEEEKALLIPGSGLQIKHNLDALLRSDLPSRYEAYSKALGGAPWQTVNDVRTTEDWDRDPDPRHDQIRIPANLTPPEPGEDPQPAPFRRSRPAPEDDGPDAAARGPRPNGGGWLVQEQLTSALLRQYAEDNAARVVRREVKTIAAKAPGLARDKDKWRAFVLETYEKHAGYTAAVMRISEGQARTYCDRQAAALLAGGAGVAETWEQDIPPRLVALALGEGDE